MPFFFHFIVGSGKPIASQNSTKLPPTLKTPLFGLLTQVGGSVEKVIAILVTIGTTTVNTYLHTRNSDATMLIQRANCTFP